MLDEPLEERGMPTWVKVFVVLGVALGLLVIGVLVFGDGEHGPGRHSFVDHGASADSDGAAVIAGCEARPFSHGGGSGALLSCEDAEGAGEDAAGFTCRNPGHGGLELEWDLDAGSFTVTVRDAGGNTVFTDSFSGAGSDTADFGTGAAGSWELEAVRDDGFAGSLSAQTFCASG